MIEADSKLKIYVAKDHKSNTPYNYDARLVTTDKRKRRCLNGKQAKSKEEMAAEEPDMATRPRTVVGDGGGLLP